MPYIQNRFFRYFSYGLFVAALLGIMGYLYWTGSSGKVVATAPVASEKPIASIGGKKGQALSPLMTRTSTARFAPVSLSPAMGEITFEIKLVQLSFFKGERGMGMQTYSLLPAEGGKPVFTVTHRGLITVPSQEETKSSSRSLKFGVTHFVARSKVPKDGLYVLDADLEQWILASPNLSLELVARTGVIQANTQVVITLASLIALALFFLFLTVPPEQRKFKSSHNDSREY